MKKIDLERMIINYIFKKKEPFTAHSLLVELEKEGIITDQNKEFVLDLIDQLHEEGPLKYGETSDGIWNYYTNSMINKKQPDFEQETFGQLDLSSFEFMHLYLLMLTINHIDKFDVTMLTQLIEQAKKNHLYPQLLTNFNSEKIDPITQQNNLLEMINTLEQQGYLLKDKNTQMVYLTPLTKEIMKRERHCFEEMSGFVQEYIQLDENRSPKELIKLKNFKAEI